MHRSWLPSYWFCAQAKQCTLAAIAELANDSSKKATDFKNQWLLKWWAHQDSNKSIPSNFHSLWTPYNRPERLEHLDRPDSGHPLPVQSTPSVQLWTPSNRPEQLKRPESGRSDTVQNCPSVQFLDALLRLNCVVFCLLNDQSKCFPRGMFPE